MPNTARAAIAASTVLHVFDKLFSRFQWPSILSALIIAALVWLWRRHAEPQRTPGLCRFLFPREIWLHRSALLDLRFVLFDKTALALLVGIGALFVVPKHIDAVAKGSGWIAHNGAHASLGIVIAYTFVLLLVEDFFRYWAHRWMHESPFLWQFHKVHHSSEVLIPLSQLRDHPVNGLVDLTRGALAVPLVTGAFLLVFPGKLTALSILGVNAGRFVFDIAGAQLRHSHVWISFGAVFERIVVSPAQHQIHHSRDPVHYNSNYGSQLAIWDWLFGTLRVAGKHEELQFGIDARDTERMLTVRAMYWVPCVDAWGIAKRWWQRRRAGSSGRRGDGPRANPV
ncbi:MAG: sterol desaturase family protein [Candidatus Andeanibacterium colombiense]|uniref:Sterol desaturase family protein n=1 Tax=Candidatus Andeanibacterium colombiense TaxID=3121345 RepID=A0AAJ5X780_9SPHN|nr:MAG: sterol desaturase family protein [Sphingomonadaceae bacterium]